MNLSKTLLMYDENGQPVMYNEIINAPIKKIYEEFGDIINRNDKDINIKPAPCNSSFSVKEVDGVYSLCSDDRIVCKDGESIIALADSPFGIELKNVESRESWIMSSALAASLGFNTDVYEASKAIYGNLMKARTMDNWDWQLYKAALFILAEKGESINCVTVNDQQMCREIVADYIMEQARSQGIDLYENAVRMAVNTSDMCVDTDKKRRVFADPEALYNHFGKQLSYISFANTPNRFDDHSYIVLNNNIVLNENGAAINLNNPLGVVGIDKEGINFVGLNGEGAFNLARLTLDEAYVAGIDLGVFEKYVSDEYKLPRKQLMAHIAQHNTDDLTIENSQFVGTYSFVEYGAVQIVYLECKKKGEISGDEAPQPVGVIKDGVYYIDTDVNTLTDPFILGGNSQMGITYFDYVCEGMIFEVWAEINSKYKETGSINLSGTDVIDLFAEKTTIEELAEKIFAEKNKSVEPKQRKKVNVERE